MALQRSDSRKSATPGRTTTLEPLGFWSYAHADDKAADNALTDLRLALKHELMQQLGRDVNLFQDVAAIPWGAGWREEIKRAIGRSNFFIPIITPRYIQSAECTREMWLFIERQNELRTMHPDLPQQSLIFPILYVDVNGIEPIDPDAFAQIQGCQIQDFTALRIDGVSTPAAKRWVANVAAGLRAVLSHRIAVPPSPEEREALDREARAAAEARALAEREAEEARKQAAEAKRQAAAEAARRAALAAEVAAHDGHVAKLAALAKRLDAGLAHSKAQQERREAEATRANQIRAALGRVVRIVAWVAGTLIALFALLVVYYMIYPPTPRDTGNEQAVVAEPLADNVSDPPAETAKPRLAAESWITAHSWAVYGHCDDPFTFSIDGETLIADSADTREQYPIIAKLSTRDRLVAKGLTLTRDRPSPGRERMTIGYPDTKVEVVPCAARR